MNDLVTLDDVKRHLRIEHNEGDEDGVVDTIRLAAQSTLAGYLKTRFDDSWDQTTAPPELRLAILMLCEDLYTNRGAQSTPQQPVGGSDQGWLPPEITRLVYRLRDPALA